MKLVLIADTHTLHDQVDVPECDILIHAGDLTGRGRAGETAAALRWLNRQRAKHIVFISGNHDFMGQDYPDAFRALVANEAPRATYLENSEVTIGGLKFWGSPYTPTFMKWAFMEDRADIDKHWNLIPDDTDVLITHGPPHKILDQAAPHQDSEHLGDFLLMQAVRRVNPRLHVFGHIHGGAGKGIAGDTIFVNASVVDEAYKVVNKPHVVDMNGSIPGWDGK